MKSLITRHPIAIGLLAGAALIAIFGAPAEAYDRGNSRADGFSSSCCDGPHGLTLQSQSRPKHRPNDRLAWNNGSTSRTGSGSQIVIERRLFFDIRSQCHYCVVVPRIQEKDHDYEGPQMKPPSDARRHKDLSIRIARANQQMKTYDHDNRVN